MYGIMCIEVISMEISKSERSNKYNPVHKKMHTLWRSMIGRCYNEQNGSYKNYGARGVTVTPSWRDYNSFLADVDSLPGFDLDRILRGELQLDKDTLVRGNKVYGPTTCCFISPSSNSGNRRNNKLFIAVNVDTLEVVRERNRELFCREHELDSSTVWRMLNRDRSNRRPPNIYKGWTFQYEDTFEIDKIPNVRTFEATHCGTGDKITFTNIREFSRRNNVNATSITACLKGRQKTAGGYSFIELEPVDYKDSTTIERQLVTYGVTRTNRVE